MQLGLASDQRARNHMEDRAVTGPVGAGLLAGVFDGHGGASVADHAAAHALDAVETALGRGLSGESLWHQVFRRLDVPLLGCGSTATLLLLRERALAAAWVGDSRALLVTGRGLRRLTPDHRIDRSDERRRVLAAGAALDPPYVIDPTTGQGLMVTRALGDHALRHVGVVADPEVVTVDLQPDALGFVLATDGLWDVVGDEEAAAACRDADPERAARWLVDLVVRRDGRDNVTVVVGRF